MLLWLALSFTGCGDYRVEHKVYTIKNNLQENILVGGKTIPPNGCEKFSKASFLLQSPGKINRLYFLMSLKTKVTKLLIMSYQSLELCQNDKACDAGVDVVAEEKTETQAGIAAQEKTETQAGVAAKEKTETQTGVATGEKTEAQTPETKKDQAKASETKNEGEDASTESIWDSLKRFWDELW